MSYNAAGILAHMTSDGVDAWTVDEPTRDDVLDAMVLAIERWDLNAERNINYRSFLPLLRLLDVYHTPQCQHWAVWALANLTKVYRTYKNPLDCNTIVLLWFLIFGSYKNSSQVLYISGHGEWNRKITCFNSTSNTVRLHKKTS